MTVTCAARRRRARLAVALTALALGGCGDSAPTAPAADANDVLLSAGAVEALASDADPRTLYIVANRYATGDGVPADQDIAERLWKVACEKGHAFACSNYGSRMIEDGQFDDAARFLARAAEAGEVEAIKNLIELHDNPGWDGASVDESVRWQRALKVLQAPVQSPVPDSVD